MTHRHVIVLTCDHRTEDGRRCSSFLIGPSSTDIAGVREAATRDGWTFTPGQPYAHIGGSDRCPVHAATSSKPATDADTRPEAASSAAGSRRSSART